MIERTSFNCGGVAADFQELQRRTLPLGYGWTSPSGDIQQAVCLTLQAAGKRVQGGLMDWIGRESAAMTPEFTTIPEVREGSNVEFAPFVAEAVLVS